MTLAESVRALRWTTRELGAYLGCSHTYAQRLVNGEPLGRFAGKVALLSKWAEVIAEAREALDGGG